MFGLFYSAKLALPLQLMLRIDSNPSIAFFYQVASVDCTTVNIFDSTMLVCCACVR